MNKLVGPEVDVSDAATLRLEQWPVARLLPSPRNARTHNDSQVAEIAGSIKAFGFSNPILVGEDGDIIAGHGRLSAAKLLGMTEVPVIVAGGLSDTQRRQLMLADNRIALNAGWDTQMLALELRDLSGMKADLASLGFTAKELAAALTVVADGETDENEIPEIPETATSQPGDLWLLGPHRLICGDATDPEVVRVVLDGVSPNLMVTDPPYGVNYDPTWRHDRGITKSARVGKVKNDDRADWTPAWQLFKGAIAYVWHAGLQSGTVMESLQRAEFAIRAQIIWAKERLVLGRGDYQWQHEPCWYAVRKTGNWVGDRTQTTLWSIPSRDQDAKTIHGTQKPVECMRRPMLNHTLPGDSIYEPFLGSGTTLIAAESCGRRCVAIEIDPIYIDVALKRWQAFTGLAATHAATGRSFAEVAEERAANDNVQPQNTTVSAEAKAQSHAPTSLNAEY